jgi:uncharacterized protein YhbP (UPF0306 family)
MPNLKNLALEILKKGYLMSLATQDSSGIWVADVIYVNDNFNLYWISDTSTRHSKAIENNKDVACSITISNNPQEPNIGLQISGKAKKMSEELPKLAFKHREKLCRKENDDAAFTKEGNIKDKSESWYCLIPNKIDIIHEPSFDFNKKTIEF